LFLQGVSPAEELLQTSTLRLRYEVRSDELQWKNALDIPSKVFICDRAPARAELHRGKDWKYTQL